MKTIMHIDFNSFFATVEQQANPRLRSRPIGVTGGDRMERTVIGAASVEAKKLGVKTGMPLFEAKKICPSIILVPGDSDKYLEVTKRFLGLLSPFCPYLEVFSIDEVFIQIKSDRSEDRYTGELEHWPLISSDLIRLAHEIKSRVRSELGEAITCSIGISYNKLLAKLAGSLIKPDGLVVIANQDEAIKVLDRVELNEICGIGRAVKARLNKMGIFNFKQLREVPLNILLFEFKSYGQFLYDASRGIDHRPILPFYEKEEIKSVGHRHTISYDTSDPEEIKQLLLKLTELVARRLRVKKLVGRTVSCWFRSSDFSGEGMQVTIPYTSDGLEIFKASWKIFHQIWDKEKIRMIGVSVSNLRSKLPQTLSLLADDNKQQLITQTLDEVNSKYGEFTLQRGTLLTSAKIKRMPNPFLADRRFKL